MIKNIQINGFKSIVNQSVELGRLNVLTGQTAVVKAIFLRPSALLLRLLMGA